MATMNISLPDALKAFAEEQGASGAYANVSDYVRDLIRKDQERRQAIAELQALIEEGRNSGPAGPWDMDAFLERMNREYAEKNAS
jgi:antitoxin ParD1/3/4